MAPARSTSPDNRAPASRSPAGAAPRWEASPWTPRPTRSTWARRTATASRGSAPPQRLQGASPLTSDHQGRLLVVDYADPYISPSEDRTTPGLEQLRDEDYKGPLLFRLDLDPTFPPPRRVLNLHPLQPRARAGRAG